MAKIKLRKIASRQLVATVRLNGAKGTFIIDTGAGNSILTNSQKSKFGLEEADIQAATETGLGFGGGNIALETVVIKELAFGNLKLHDFPFFLMDMHELNAGFEAEGIESVDGVIGADILFLLHAIINYQQQTLTLSRTKQHQI